MVDPGRSGFTATLLADGRVLIAGGGDFDVGASAELYDPATGTFSSTGSMAVARGLHTATLLQDGRVLIAGGEDKDATAHFAELYDPKTGTFSSTGTMFVAPQGTATVLSDGRVLFAGGSAAGASLVPGAGAPCDQTQVTTECEVVPTSNDLPYSALYDPTTGTYGATGSMMEGRSQQTATLLSDGRVLIANSQQGDGTAELYNASTGRFSPTGSMAINEWEGTATLLSDGKVLFAGGQVLGSQGYTETASAQIYDPKTGTFSVTGSMGTARLGHTATLLKDGRVLVIGGQDESLNALLSAEIYDPQSSTFSPTGSIVDLPKNAAGWDSGVLWAHTATLLSDGRVLIANRGLAEVYLP
jgi:hypothetical protein